MSNFPPLIRVRRPSRPPAPANPFDQLDVLIVAEMGIDHHEAGMDPAIHGRLLIETMPDLERPLVTRLVVLGLSDASRGDAVGVGFADLTTARLVARIDPVALRAGAMATKRLERVRIPISLPTDQDAIARALDTCWRIDPSEARMMVIANTADLDEFWVTQPLAAEARAQPNLRVDDASRPIPFDADGTLDVGSLFPNLASGRRARPVAES